MPEKETKYFRRKIQGSYITSVISITLVLFTLGFLGLIVLHAKSLSNYIKENIGFEIIMNSTVSEAEIIYLQKTLDAKFFIKSTEYITKEEATRQLTEALGSDFIEVLGEENNPLLPSIDVRFKAPWANNDSLTKIEEMLLTNPGVKEVYYQKSLVQAINKNLQKISVIILAFSLLLLLIAMALINNTIRLSIYSKRFIIRSMQLVGATPAFIRKPFIIKGVVQGFVSAIFAVILISVVLSAFVKNIPELALLSTFETRALLYLIIIITGISLSGISTWLAVRKFLKMNSDKLY